MVKYKRIPWQNRARKESLALLNHINFHVYKAYKQRLLESTLSHTQNKQLRVFDAVELLQAKLQESALPSAFDESFALRLGAIVHSVVGKY